ncbi:oxidoreductase [Eremomyces bilateralis CBS 781.70]|uniref:Oxidoreductase n=1 Tax=Eremomyces bilateralis CBS 781.70 TaxID=1392243 RepID=A0A6G1FU76_9PEZI|nr:oxidoreductase [Eremomyces bilateralis CBS 781.70]KAF1809313.1 oxidoreductase [Eremomyces bilateralis CBS 781.70]
MAPIRTAIIGLSAAPTGSAWAALAHFPYLSQSPEYQVVALLNSSKEAAETAIKKFNFPGDTKAYGTSEELAADDEVDLVKPILERGKASVFCEWPLGADLKEFREMTDAIGETGVGNVVGFQGGFTPLVTTLKALIADGKIGKVLSSTVTASGMHGGPSTPKAYAFTDDRKIGANTLTIVFGHFTEALFAVVGKLASFNLILDTKWRTATVLDEHNDLAVFGTQDRTSPDDVLLQGRVESGALLSVHLRGGPPSPSETVPDTIWRIYGEKGEITISSPQPNIINTVEGVSIELHDHASQKVEKIEIRKDKLEHLPEPARNIGRVYEAFADKTWYPDFQHALRRYKLVYEIYRRFDNGQQDTKPHYA